jgi:hypothetical protein
MQVPGTLLILSFVLHCVNATGIAENEVVMFVAYSAVNACAETRGFDQALSKGVG